MKRADVISASGTKQPDRLALLLYPRFVIWYKNGAGRCSGCGRKGVCMTEKRSHPRFVTSVKVQDVATLSTGRTKNISLGGCLVENTEGFHYLPVNTPLMLAFEIPGVAENIVISGEIRHWGKEGDGFGVQFKEVDKKSAYYLGRFMGIFL
jgi:hypothetical protein